LDAAAMAENELRALRAEVSAIRRWRFASGSGG